MEVLVIGAVLALLTWHITKRYVPAWLPPIALRVVVVLIVVSAMAALVRCAPDPTLAALGVAWLLGGCASFAIRRWLARSKERDARRAALQAARMQVRRRALPPGPASRSAPPPTHGGSP